MTIYNLAKITEDYFQKPKQQTAEERAAELRAKMEAMYLKFEPLAQNIRKKELQQDLMKIDTEKLKA